MKSFIVLMLSLFSLSLIAQMPNKGNQGNNNGQQNMNFEVPKAGFSVVTGSVRNAATKEPIEFASVSLIRTQDSTAQCGMITGSNGKFRFENLPVGEYLPMVNFIGYKQYRGKLFVISHSSYRIDIGQIDVQPISTNLQEVEIAADKSTFEMHSDKKVFNVEKNLTTVGGTASDVLKNVPSVTVDQDGNVSLRGKSNVQILIDNKPSTLGSDLPTVLQQIPANSIESVEIITNPSAKYSAEGVTGIINIVLKKNKLQGYNGILMGGMGTNPAINTINKYNATGTFNFKTEKFNVSTTYSFRNDTRRGWGTNLSDTLGRKMFFQNDTSTYSSQMNYGKVNVDYDINAYNTVGANISLFRLNNPYNAVNNNYNYTPQDAEIYNSHRDFKADGKNYMQSIAPGISYRHIFIVPKHTLDLDFTASNFKRYDNTLATDHFIPLGVSANERTARLADLKMYNGQIDYVNPVGEDKTLEAGYKLNTFDLGLNNDILVKTPFSPDYKRDDRRSTFTNTNTSEQGLYLTYSGKYKKIDYKVGLRGEYATKEIGIKKIGAGADSIHFKKSYADLFPSVFLTRNLKENRSIGLNYSRRISRPDFMQLIPVTDYSQPKQLRKGNADLEPEYTHSMEFNYSKTWEENSLNLTLYDYYTTNVITYLRQQLGGDTTLITFANTKTSNDVGTEAVLKTKINKWWEITTSINAYMDQINGENLGLGTTHAFQGDIHVISSFRPRWDRVKNISMQLTGYGQSKQTLIQGYIEPSFSFDLGLKKEWGKVKQYSLTASVNDIFNQRKFVIHSLSGNINMLTDRRFDSRTISVTFMYRYGKLDANFFKKKKGQDNPNMMGGDGGF